MSNSIDIYKNKILTSKKEELEELFFEVIFTQESSLIELFKQHNNFNLNITDSSNKNAINKLLDEAKQFNTKDEKYSFLDFIKYLISIGIDINSKDNLGQTPMHKAVNKGCNELIKVLLDFGDADISIQDNIGRTPIHNLVWKNDLKNAERVLRFDKDALNIADYAGYRPIEYAAILGYAKLVEFFINNNAEIKNKNKRALNTTKFFNKYIQNLDIVKDELSNTIVNEFIESLKQDIKNSL